MNPTPLTTPGIWVARSGAGAGLHNSAGQTPVINSFNPGNPAITNAVSKENPYIFRGYSQSGFSSGEICYDFDEIFSSVVNSKYGTH